MSTRVRFAPSPTGSLHLGSALSAVANRRRGDWLLLRIDDTDRSREVDGAVEAILEDLEWLGLPWNEGPSRQSERVARHREAATSVGEPDADGSIRFRGTTLLRPDGSPTYHLASVVDDHDFEITHVVRGADHRSNTELQRELSRALGFEPPEYVHHGLLLGADGKKLSKREGAPTLAQYRERGVPAEALRAYLEELGEPAHDVHLDEPRIRRLAIDAIGSLSDEELAARAGAPPQLARALRGARDLVEARADGRRNPRAAARHVARGGEADADPVRRAARQRARRQGHRSRAEGGRRRPEGIAARPDRRRARTGAVGRDRGAPAGRGAEAGRCSVEVAKVFAEPE